MKNKISRFPALSFAVVAILITLNALVSTALAQYSAFSYQGRLNDGSNPANGSYTLRFTLYDSVTNGNVLGGPLTNTVTASNGLFTTTLDFGLSALLASYPGSNAWLSIAARPTGSNYSFVQLSPRQPLMAVPYAAVAGAFASDTPVQAQSLNVGAGNDLMGQLATITGGFQNTISNGGWSVDVIAGGQNNHIMNAGSAVIAGGASNTIAPGALAAAIGGGANNSALGAAAVVAGGQNNIASSWAATVSGGSSNIASGDHALVAGGEGNSASGNHAYVGGGSDNTAEGDYAAVVGGGGHSNHARGNHASVGGGDYNAANGSYSTIAGGLNNFTATNASYSIVGGGDGNYAFDVNGTIGGGENNEVWGRFGTLSGGSRNSLVDPYATIGGGDSNQAGFPGVPGFGTTVGGGEDNAAFGYGSTVGGGYQNWAYGFNATVGGGGENRATNDYTTVAGGQNNLASGLYCAIGGGAQNVAAGWNATVGGGTNNVAWGSYSTVSGGMSNLAYGVFNTVSGGCSNTASSYAYATVPGGKLNVAGGYYSFAAGYQAQAQYDGSFVWADSTGGAFPDDNANQFKVRANGGALIQGGGVPQLQLSQTSPDACRLRLHNPSYTWDIYASYIDHSFGFHDGTGEIMKLSAAGGVLFTNTGSGGANQSVHWTPGNGSWSWTSDRNTKDKFKAVDVQAVLTTLSKLPILEWNYIGYAQRHIGPMSQDFHALFPLNSDDKSLQDADLHGVALAAIQGLNQKLEEQLRAKDAKIQTLEERLAALEARLNQTETK